MKRISSNTFFIKRIFPVFWFGFMVVFALSLFFGKAADNSPFPILLAPVAMSLFGYFLMKKMVFDLADEVSDAGDHLVIRFGKTTEEVKLANIININYTLMMNPPRVTLMLRQPCRFGKEVSFSPATKGFAFFKNSLINELIERIDATRIA